MSLWNGLNSKESIAMHGPIFNLGTICLMFAEKSTKHQNQIIFVLFNANFGVRDKKAFLRAILRAQRLKCQNFQSTNLHSRRVEFKEK